MAPGFGVSHGFSSVRKPPGPAFGDDFAFVVAIGAPSEIFTVPCQNVGTFNAVIDWGDGSASAITAYNDPDLAHVYPAAGEYTVRIRGAFPNIYFNDGGDKAKVRRVLQLGKVGWLTLLRAFNGCSGMTSFVAGNCDTSACTNMGSLFLGCSALRFVQLAGMSTANVTVMTAMFSTCTALTAVDVSGFNTAKVTAINAMFSGATTVAVAGLAGWSIGAVTTATNFLASANNALDTPAYDALLIAWAAQAPAQALTISFGDAQYTPGGAAQAARTALVSTYGWTITDGGAAA